MIVFCAQPFYRVEGRGRGAANRANAYMPNNPQNSLYDLDDGGDLVEQE